MNAGFTLLLSFGIVIMAGFRSLVTPSGWGMGNTSKMDQSSRLSVVVHGNNVDRRHLHPFGLG